MRGYPFNGGGIMRSLLLLLFTGLACCLAAPAYAGEGKEKKEYVKVAVKGKLVAYRHLLFGRTAVSVTAGGKLFWLDYSQNEKLINEKISPKYGEKTVVVTGELDIRAAREGGKPLLVVVVSDLKLADEE